jgi:NAD(P)H dehydrogenase (quinone)
VRAAPVGEDGAVTSVVILGGGPGGYEAALVAAQLGADVTLVDRDGAGGSAVLTDCVPSKTLVATAEVMSTVAEAAELGVRLGGQVPEEALHATADRALSADMTVVDKRVLSLAAAQSADIRAGVEAHGVRWVEGVGRLGAGGEVTVDRHDGGTESLAPDVVLVATGAHPRVLPEAMPDGDRILTWEQLYGLSETPERLVVVGSGVTGAEFASAYQALGSQVVLVSSRDRVLPGEDADAAAVIEDVFRRRGMEVLSRSRATAVRSTGSGVEVTLQDGRVVEGSHCLMAVGSIPNTDGIGLEAAGVALGPGGFVAVDRVSRTSARGIYAAGDCTGVLMLASVAAMQGRVAMWHALGDAVQPLELSTVSSNIFTEPEIATVGVTQAQVDAGESTALVVKLPLQTNARAKMQGVRDGFVKLFALPGTRIVVGGVVVAPRASELVFPVALAVQLRLTVDDLANTFTVYPSLSGSVAEAARLLHKSGGR